MFLVALIGTQSSQPSIEIVPQKTLSNGHADWQIRQANHERSSGASVWNSWPRWVCVPSRISSSRESFQKFMCGRFSAFRAAPHFSR